MSDHAVSPMVRRADRWRRVKEIFYQAIELDPDAREALLDAACDGREGLRREVESLLIADARKLEIFSAPVAEAAACALGVEARAHRVNESLGPYRVVRELGRGGAGTVYLALRDDDLYQRKVAVKVIERGDSEAVRRRFERECQILASLDHPSIARLLDAGTARDGRPYVVMELVEGQPIDRYCDQGQLSVEERLRLFLKVCAAVEHAHRNLIVHRDLKPGNILVGAEGEPKLLDFGIAKILGPELSAAALHTTLPSLQPLTPLFASPEQLRGEGEVGPASDIYSLGVLLYMLLVGNPPYTLRGSSPREIERTVCELPIPTPSAGFEGDIEVGDAARARRTTPRGLRHRLRGDLDAIVLEALRKEPHRRYSSVAALAADVERHLERRPVLARREAAGYRLWRWARRHRLAAALGFGLMVLAAAMSFQSWRLSSALRDSHLQRQRAEQISTFLEELFEVVDPDASRGATVTAREILDEGARRIEGELTGQPELQVPLMETMGRVYRQLGLLERGGRLLEVALERRRGGVGGPVDLAGSLADLGFLRLGEGRLDEAETLTRESLRLRRRQLGEKHPEVLASLNQLAEVLHAQGDFDRAEHLFREVLETLREQHGDEHLAVAEAEQELGLLLLDRGAGRAAEPLLRQSLETQRRLNGEESIVVATLMNRLAFVLEERGELEAAGPIYRRSLEIYELLLGGEHRWVTLSQRNLARVMAKREDFRGAESLLRSALEVRRRTFSEGDPGIGYTAQELGDVLCRDGREPEGEALLWESAAILAAAEVPAVQQARGELRLAECLLRRSELAEAERLLRTCLSILEAEGWEKSVARAEAGLEQIQARRERRAG